MGSTLATTPSKSRTPPRVGLGIIALPIAVVLLSLIAAQFLKPHEPVIMPETLHVALDSVFVYPKTGLGVNEIGCRLSLVNSSADTVVVRRIVATLSGPVTDEVESAVDWTLAPSDSVEHSWSRSSHFSWPIGRSGVVRMRIYGRSGGREGLLSTGESDFPTCGWH